MDIVIKILEEDYTTLRTRGSIDWLKAKCIFRAIADGTPLPKGHSDLVYRDEILASFVAARAELSGEFDEGLHEAWEIVNSEDATPAIIKADKVVEDGNNS